MTAKYEVAPMLIGKELCKCPFCGGDISFTEEDGHPDSLLHSMPPCQRYLDLEIDEFMHQVNVQRGLHN